MPVDQTGTPDSKGNIVYSAGATMPLPSSCWRLNNSNGIYYTALRTHAQGSPSSAFSTFDREGLECLADKVNLSSIGADGDWFAWMPSHCVVKDTGGGVVKYMVIRTE